MDSVRYVLCWASPFKGLSQELEDLYNKYYLKLEDSYNKYYLNNPTSHILRRILAEIAVLLPYLARETISHPSFLAVKLAPNNGFHTSVNLIIDTLRHQISKMTPSDIICPITTGVEVFREFFLYNKKMTFPFRITKIPEDLTDTPVLEVHVQRIPEQIEVSPEVENLLLQSLNSGFRMKVSRKALDLGEEVEGVMVSECVAQNTWMALVLDDFPGVYFVSRFFSQASYIDPLLYFFPEVWVEFIKDIVRGAIIGSLSKS